VEGYIPFDSLLEQEVNLKECRLTNKHFDDSNDEAGQLFAWNHGELDSEMFHPYIYFFNI